MMNAGLKLVNKTFCTLFLCQICFISRRTSFFCLSSQCVHCYNHSPSNVGTGMRLKSILTHTSQAEHAVCQSHEITMFQHGLECTRYTRTVRAWPWWNA